MSAGRALITGATGMIGTALTARLQRDGWTLSTLTRTDFLQADSLDRAVRAAAPDVVFHLAGPPFNPPPTLAEFIDATVNNTAALLRALDDAGNASRIVFASSAAVYANAAHAAESQTPAPATWLGAVKAMAEVLLATAARKTGRAVVQLRLYTPYGPGERPERLIPSLVAAARARRPIALSDGKQERDYVYIDDVVEAFVAAAGVDAPQPLIFNIGSGAGSSVRDVVALVLSMLDATELAQFGALPTRPDEIMHMAADITAARNVLGWSPRTSLHEGLRSTIQWYMNDSMHRV